MSAPAAARVERGANRRLRRQRRQPRHRRPRASTRAARTAPLRAGRSAFATGGTVMPLAREPRPARPLRLDPLRRRLAVLSFAIDPGERHARSSSAASPLPASMCWIAPRPAAAAGCCAASYGASLVAVSPIDDDGVAGAAQQVVATAPNAHSIQADPANRFAFAACLGGDVVSAAAPSTPRRGTLERQRPSRPWRTRAGAGPAPLRLPSDRRRSSTCSTSSTRPSTSLEHRPGRGTLRATLQTIALRCRPAPSASRGPPTSTSRPDGRFLYASERRSSTLAVVRRRRRERHG